MKTCAANSLKNNSEAITAQKVFIHCQYLILIKDIRTLKEVAFR